MEIRIAIRSSFIFTETKLALQKKGKTYLCSTTTYYSLSFSKQITDLCYEHIFSASDRGCIVDILRHLFKRFGVIFMSFFKHDEPAGRMSTYDDTDEELPSSAVLI